MSPIIILTSFIETQSIASKDTPHYKAPSLEELLSAKNLTQADLDKSITFADTQQLSQEIMRWEEVAEELQISQPNIEAIKCDFKKTEDRRREMLEKWINKNPYNATYVVLIKALLKLDITSKCIEAILDLLASGECTTYVAISLEDHYIF